MTDTAAISQWYDINAHNEHDRLQQFGLEYALSLRAINQCIDSIQTQRSSSKAKSLRILDLGGGTGRCSVELASHGHAVTYTDISAAEVAIGTQYAASRGVRLAHIEVVDALQVEKQHPNVFKQGYYDVVLCMGPLYHLLEASERQQVILSCARLVSSGGYVCTAFVTKWAHLRDVAQRDPGRVMREVGFYRGYALLDDNSKRGRYDRVAGRTGWHVGGGREVREMVERAGQGLLEVQKVVACEGFLGGGLSSGLDKAVGSMDPAFQEWVDICAAVAEREEMWGASDHLLVVARKL